MARVHRVKSARQRYETVPVLDDNGEPVKIALTRKDGAPKMTRAKSGREPRPVSITKTRPDKSKPKPLLVCGKCGVTIQVGDPYKWVKPKSGPYGGSMRVRCDACPTWMPWDLSNSLSAQVQRIEHEADVSHAENPDEVREVLANAADAIRDLAEQKRDGAQNIEDGFGHATSMSEELAELADELETWADSVDETDLAELDSFECPQGCSDGQAECDACDGTGVDDSEPCRECDGTGEVECPECDATGCDLEAARDAWAESVQDALAECPA